MATTVNAFDLLKGAESTLQQKKKKKSKAKKVDTIPVAETVVEPSSDEQIVEQVRTRVGFAICGGLQQFPCVPWPSSSMGSTCILLHRIICFAMFSVC